MRSFKSLPLKETFINQTVVVLLVPRCCGACGFKENGNSKDFDDVLIIGKLGPTMGCEHIGM